MGGQRGDQNVACAPSGRSAGGLFMGAERGETGVKSGLQSRGGSRESDPNGWPRIFAEHFRDKFTSLGSIDVQRSRVEMWECILQCQTRDGIFQGPALVFSDYIEAKARLKMKQRLGIDGILAVVCFVGRCRRGQRLFALLLLDLR